MSLDERLLQMNRPDQAKESADEQSGDFRAAKRNKQLDKRSGGKYHRMSFRERLSEARRDKAKNPKDYYMVSETKVNPLRKSTSNLLRQSWLHVIDSYGLTLLWVDVHFFLHNVLGDTFFAPPGQEWIDRFVQGSKLKADQIGESLGWMAKEVGIVEKGVMGCVNFVLLLIVLSIIVVVYLLIDSTSSVWKIIKAIADIVL